MNDVQELDRPTPSDAATLLRSYACSAAMFAGAPDALYERHLKFDNIVDPPTADARERYDAAARAVRDILSDRWLRTDQTYERENPKRVYYVSIEFLIGRSLANNVMNLMLDPSSSRDVRRATAANGGSSCDEEPDAGLGNGGLGRLAACFLDSMATMAAAGDGLRPALRARHLPAELPQRLAGGTAGQLAASSRPLGGRAPGRKRRGRVRLHVRIARRARLRIDPEQPLDAGWRAL